MTRLLVGPFNRVEGDLQVNLDIADGRVVSAQVNSNMYRGFEQILRGKNPHDALVYVPRICGICSVSQSVAAARALADLARIQVPPNGVLMQNLILAVENLADHLSHFYLFFMPDFTRAVYSGQPWHADMLARFDPQSGTQTRRAMAARERWLQMLGVMAGKWPHTQCVEPGGSTRAIEPSERVRLLSKLREFRGFLEEHLFGGPLEEVLELADEDALWSWYSRDPGHGDLRCFLSAVQTLGLSGLGQGPGRYLSYGAYAQPNGAYLFQPGLWSTHDDKVTALDLSCIGEDASYAWMDDSSGPVHPTEGVTLPRPDKTAAYTWNKAPRWAGQVVETGAIARQLMNGQALVRSLVARHGGTVLTRVIARLLELASVVPQMETWLHSLQTGQAYCVPTPALPDGIGVGLNEAARGSLGHWAVVHRGVLSNYQIIAPTTWNFSPRDAGGTPGALEQALVNVPVQPGEHTPVAVQHVVRSFDPCMVCTVH